MNDITPFEVWNREDYNFYIGGRKINGVQNLEVNLPINNTFLNFVGQNRSVVFPALREPATLSITQLLLNKDYLYSLTNNSGINSFIVNSRDIRNNSITFESGYITSYSQRCSIGQIPLISAEISYFGKCGGGFIPIDGTQLSYNFSDIIGGVNNVPAEEDFVKFINYGSIELDINGLSTNKITNYSLQITPKINVVYGMGSRYPIIMDLVKPTEFNLSIDFDINNFQYKDLENLVANTELKNIELRTKDYNFDNIINQYSFNDTIISSQRFNIETSDGQPKGNLLIRGQIF